MAGYVVRFAGAALVALFACGAASPSQADTGAVRVVFTKGGFVVGVGHGVLTFKGRHYPFRGTQRAGAGLPPLSGGLLFC